MYPYCSIIVLNYNGEILIIDTLNSLANLSYPKDRYEVIVVDNKSTDKSKEAIDTFLRHSGEQSDSRIDSGQARMTNIITKYLDKNLGFAGGNNEGIKQAKGKYVILLNNDATVDQSWLSELVAVAEKDKAIFAVGSRVYLRDTNKIQNAGIMMFEDGYGRDIGAIVKDKTQDYAEDVGQYDREKETYAACAVSALYRKSILDKISYLDDSFFMYYEDVELSERAMMHGYKIMYAPKAIVHHHHAASSGEWSPFFIYHSEYGRLLHMFFWFPQRIFWREYIKFVIKAKLRVLYGLKNRKLDQQIQYLNVAWNMFIALPSLYKKRSVKMKSIEVKQIEKNYINLNKRS